MQSHPEGIWIVRESLLQVSFCFRFDSNLKNLQLMCAEFGITSTDFHIRLEIPALIRPVCFLLILSANKHILSFLSYQSHYSAE